MVRVSSVRHFDYPEGKGISELLRSFYIGFLVERKKDKMEWNREAEATFVAFLNVNFEAMGEKGLELTPSWSNRQVHPVGFVDKCCSVFSKLNSLCNSERCYTIGEAFLRCSTRRQLQMNAIFFFLFSCEIWSSCSLFSYILPMLN